MLEERLRDPAFVRWVADNATEEERRRFGPYLAAEELRRERESNYEEWLKKTFPQYVTAPLAEHHHEFWQWVWSIDESRPKSFVGVWNRGGAKSTSAEMACVALGARGRRKYGWYVCRTQDQADDHVGNVGAMLESKEIADAYPDMGEKRLGKFGNSQGWRRNRLRTASGFTIDALGLDTARRGGKLEDQRPDFIIIDDVDKQDDSPKVTRKLIGLLTKSIFPAGAENVAILAIQNLIHSNGIFARLVNGTADYLRRRVLSGPIPALRNFAYEQRSDGTYRITSGEPTWQGYGVDRCEADINDFGPKAFREEAQHEVDRVEGAKWTREQLDAMRVATSDVPDLVSLWVGVDPSGGDGPDNDEQGIIVAGRGSDGICYVLEDVSCKLKSHGWGLRAVSAYHRHDADGVLGETNFGGDMVEGTIKAIDEDVKYDDVHASRGKIPRIDPIAALCGDPDKPESWEHSKIKLVGSFPELEEEMRTYTEDSGWSPNRLDGLAWVATKLMLAATKKKDPFAAYLGTA